MVLLQLWHCAAALEDQVLKLSAPGVKLVSRNRFPGNRLAIIVFVSQVPLERFLSGRGCQTSRQACHQAFPK
jgi:hypothetical protein